MNGMRYQPQGVARLDRGNPLLRGAQAILVGGLPANLVTGQPLSVVGSGAATRAVPAGRADSFRKNFYKATESLPAIGSRDYVEFWMGYPSGDVGARGNGSDTGFLLGSSNNSTGIAGNIGNNRSQGGEALHWGAVTDAGGWSRLTTANEVLAPGVLAVIVVVRRFDRFELWRDGILRRTLMQAPQSITASQMIVGSFIANTDYWTSSSDMVMAGRLIGAWEPDQVRAFSINPWQVIVDPLYDDFEVAAQAGYTLNIERAAMALAGGNVGMRVARRLRVEPASLALAPANVAMRAARRLTVVPASLAMTGGSVTLHYAAKTPPGSYTLSVSPAAMTLAAGNVGMRAARRLRVPSASLSLSTGGARALAARRLGVAPARLVLTGGTVTLRYSAAGAPFDITKIHPSRLVIFEGSGSRVTPFEGSGSRITPFAGGGSRITRFE